ncbi:hypothetical protein [Pelomonas sp. Root1444]|uniref:hypothetical protein n=1 Tax=Pelomonas sp. Root1444 TaxID=1736464 RepID=UPI0007025C3C|nr:hypothetical protein [Pelomonas sp. Root1444]KQY80923.1 hypothetical protein ASD35_03490 [Pelomonas sp. Root1444]
MPGVRLDCESRESAFDSLRQLFGCSVERLRAFLSDASVDEEFSRDYQRLPQFDEFVYQRACAALGTPQVPEELCWFHGTRVPPGTNFADGILPLPLALESLKRSIHETLTNDTDRQEVATAFARGDGLTFQLQHKLTSGTEFGPFAMFVLETALNAHATGQHSYVDMPEIIEDLCLEVQASCGRDLLPAFEAAWQPTVVKFVTPAFSPEFHIGVALCYLRSCALHGGPTGSSIANFDGENTAVPASSILRVISL